MYPDFQYLLQSLFGVNMPNWLSLFKTFGLMVAAAFIAAAWVTGKELKRKEQQGLLKPEYKTIVVGKPLSITDLIISVITGFLIGFKIAGVYGNVDEVSHDPMHYLLSTQGNFIAGIIIAIFAGFNKYYENKKQQLPKPETKTYAVYPHDLIMEIVMVAAAGGIIGAKIFNAFETWDDFIKNPIQSLTSSSGLTFLGGLILATTCFYFFARYHKIPFKHLADAAAPGILLAYGIGRIGCQLCGDGDWGIYNTAYISNQDGTLVPAAQSTNQFALHMITGKPMAHFPAPGWLPNWLFGMNYPHNVGHEGMTIANCTGEYCSVLPVSVFPTPIYESIVCILLFFVLWFFRNKMTRTLQMFGAYLFLAGIERFLVELIRVNSKYDWGFIKPTQAEILSVVLMIAGLGLFFFYKDKPAELKQEVITENT